ncbi:unnamed protein product [Vitrella brassicaformis CCMP3155]|uniref:Uncharacterized protein n=1 Tax=Vitrella brassicaformis (strain CCMP3155) TaxID=1169540 RepID=A0A0G4F1X8_VITBC|nr:unnamed protein product [Vitrella brassicaformis CCMP3155]|eukprot:CEM05758.1 unnamed protein product [Vitrella brassicaformis CCMP3155]
MSKQVSGRTRQLRDQLSDVESVKYIIDRDEHVLTHDKDGTTPFMYAAVNGQVEVMSVLYAKDSNLLTQKNSDGGTALHFAAKTDHTAVVTQLLKWGGRDLADLLDARTNDGWTPFIVAAGCGQLGAMKLIHAKGGDDLLMQKTYDDWTALHWAAHGGRYAVVAQLLEWGGGREMLDARNENGLTPFIVAAGCGQVSVLKLIHAEGGNSLLKDKTHTGNTALHLAGMQGHTSVVKQLLEWGGGALLNMKNNKGETPWDTATSSARQTMASYKK